MLSRLAIIALLVATSAIAAAQDIPPPEGFVTDRAGVIDAATEEKLTELIQELQQKTGAEIAVLTVHTTEPLDDFTYAMRVADQWKAGKKGEDTGVLVLLAVRDRKVRVLTGYGVEGVLPDGLVGAIQDREMVPEFRAGRLGEGVWRGVAALADRIATSRGVELTGVPAPRARPVPARPFPLWAILLLVLVSLLMMRARRHSRRRFGRGRGRDGGPVFIPGGFPGGFGGGGGGFGGFGGGGFGGGGAGRGW